ncbi:MAB_1171c family putative transporter [Streptomyces sp. NPDC048595]|uniref:MAB_1171c family putative transporter n=1 Tax=Streptomyces sp. NPDC048595 TaxID=3365576 RepID=UPI0037169E6B
MTAVKAVVFPACAVLCALALLYKLRDLRHHRRDPALLALLIAFGCKGISFTLSTPSVAEAVDARLGVSDIGALGIHLFGGVASSAAFLTAIVYWVYPPEAARRRALVRLLIAALCAVAMVTMWAVAGTGAQHRSAHYLLQNAHRPLVAAYLLLYVSAFGAGMIEIIRLCRRYGRVAGRQWLRRGLYCTAIGASACLVYCLNRLLSLIAVQSGLDPLEWELLTPVANGTGILFLVTGLTMPSWGPRLAEWRRRVRNFVTYQRLHPLWAALYAAVPDIALNPQHAGRLARFLPGDISYRLYRMVIEIQDGLLALRPYMAPAVAAEARRSAEEAGLSGDRLHAMVQARSLVSALRAKHDDRPPVREPEAAGPEADTDGGDAEEQAATNGGYAEEIGWLLHVARAYTAVRSTDHRSTDRSTVQSTAGPTEGKVR